jgi:TetR/AcrR family transcriptional regulator, repressor for neighboring sulfatase
MPIRVRDEQRAATEAAILDAAWDQFAGFGPDGASLREVAASAGCAHGLVARYYGSKDGLVGAVSSQLAVRVDRATSRIMSSEEEPLFGFLNAARTHRSCLQLLVRSALGDLPPRGFPACLHADWFLSQLPGTADDPTPPLGPDRRSRLCAYAAASLVFGFVTFEDFLIAATGLRPLAPRRRDRAIASAARYLLDVATESEPRLAPRDLSAARVYLTPGGQPATSAREALLGSAIELFAARGPASVSVRDIARHAGVNQGLIYRHFGSKDALLAEALERGSAEMFPAALAEEGFDFDAMSWLLHNGATAPRLIARILVDDVDISTVRRRFPILRRLIDAYDRVPSGAGPADLSDPRVAVVATAAMALGSSIWGDHLRGSLGLGVRDGIDVAIADLARVLVLAPFGSADEPREKR